MPTGKKFGGRVKGTPNKNNAPLKEMILTALTAAGGVEYLKRQAIDNPGPFLGLIGKILPLQLTGRDGGAIIIRINADDAEL